MKRKDYELSAAASLAERVIDRAKQMLANKQILMEDKKAEVISFVSQVATKKEEH